MVVAVSRVKVCAVLAAMLCEW